MEYLHNNRAEFLTAINLTTEKYGILPAVAEKDYYVTMIKIPENEWIRGKFFLKKYK